MATLQECRCGEVAHLTVIDAVSAGRLVSVPGVLAERIPDDPHAGGRNRDDLDAKHSDGRSSRKRTHHFRFSAPSTRSNVVGGLDAELERSERPQSVHRVRSNGRFHALVNSLPRTVGTFSVLDGVISVSWNKRRLSNVNSPETTDAISYLSGANPSLPGAQLNVICWLWICDGLTCGADGGCGVSRLLVV